MQTIHIDTDTRDYDVLIGKDILGLVGEKTRETAGGTRAFLVSNVNVDPLYGKQVTQSLEIAGYEVSKMESLATSLVSRLQSICEAAK